MNLGVERHMGETKTINDPPEFKIDATLKQIQAELSKSDYNVLLAIARENINEKGDFETLLATNGNARPTDLPIRKRYKSGNSRPSSRNSDGTEKSLKRLTSQDVEPDAKRIEFKFKFTGFEVGKKWPILCRKKMTKRGGGGKKSPILRRHSLWNLSRARHK